ncbi:MAG: hypothetical protein FJ295_06485 [Planctomycetes bacterium]|nr:hypothetical protein [Planctomycetota bacterium]
MLDLEEYVEQAYFFQAIAQRILDQVPLQDIMVQVREEILSTTNLPLAIDFLLGELKHLGVLAPAMQRLSHYFSPFQAFIMRQAENEKTKFDFRVALEVLRQEAAYRASGLTVQGLFLFQLETICRNRLRYDHGLTAMAQDPSFDAAWREWILTVRRQLGTIDLADLIYVRSQYYVNRRLRERDAGTESGTRSDIPPVVLFGEKEGKIALAHRRKDPLYLFSSLQRHLGYPAVARRKPIDETVALIPQLQRRVEQLETRVKLLEEDQRGGFDLTRFYQNAPRPIDPPGYEPDP